MKFKNRLSRLSVTITLTIFMLNLFGVLAPVSAAKKIEEKAVETYKKLRTKDITLTIEKGVVYIMVGNNRWDAARTNLKLLCGDKLKLIPGTIAIINFYDEFDIHLSESEMTTIEPAGITQLINEALFRTTYKDGAYISEVVKEPSKLAQYKFRQAIKNRDLKLEYAKTTLVKKSPSRESDEMSERSEKTSRIRTRVMQARNFGNGFTPDYSNSEKKLINDEYITYFEREKERVEKDMYNKMASSESLKQTIIKRTGDGLNIVSEQKQLDALYGALRENALKLDYINTSLRGINEAQNKLKLTPKNKEW